MADPEITANIGSLDPLPSGTFDDADLLEIERVNADPTPNDNYRATWGQLKAAIAAAIGSGAQRGDTLVTARNPGAGWLEQDRVYSQASYPDLYAMVGLIGDAPPGANWSSYAPGALPNTSLNDACWISDRVGIAVGNGIIWRTTNGGASWASISVTGNLFSCARVSADVALATGASGAVLRSTDAGATWSAVTSGTTSMLRAITVFSASRVFLHADTSGQNRLSTDGGASFGAGASTAASMSYLSVRFGPSVAVVFPNAGTTAYRTTNAGASWTSITVPSVSNPRGSAALDGGVGIMATVGGAVIRSVDNGASWTSITTGAGTSVFAAETVDEDTLVVLSSSGASAVSFDRGTTWQTAATLTGAACSLVVPGEAVIAVGNGAQWRSLPEYGYDSATQFKTPVIAGIGTGLKGYIKA